MCESDVSSLALTEKKKMRQRTKKGKKKKLVVILRVKRRERRVQRLTFSSMWGCVKVDCRGQCSGKTYREAKKQEN